MQLMDACAKKVCYCALPCSMYCRRLWSSVLHCNASMAPCSSHCDCWLFVNSCFGLLPHWCTVHHYVVQILENEDRDQ